MKWPPLMTHCMRREFTWLQQAASPSCDLITLRRCWKIPSSVTLAILTARLTSPGWMQTVWRKMSSSLRQVSVQAFDVKMLGVNFIVSWVWHVSLKCRTKKPRCNTDVGPIPRCDKAVFYKSSYSADSHVVVQLLCVVACINVCAYLKHPKHWQPYNCVGHRQISYTLVEMGSTALVDSTALYISHKGLIKYL